MITGPLYTLSQQPYLESTWNRLCKGERVSSYSNVGVRWVGGRVESVHYLDWVIAPIELSPWRMQLKRTA